MLTVLCDVYKIHILNGLKLYTYMGTLYCGRDVSTITRIGSGGV